MINHKFTSFSAVQIYGRKCRTAFWMAYISNSSMCRDVSVADHSPAADWLLQWAPQPLVEATVYMANWGGRAWMGFSWRTLDALVHHFRNGSKKGGLLADPDWGASGLRGKVEEANIWEDLRAPDLTLTPASQEVKGSPKLSHTSPGGTNEHDWLLLGTELPEGTSAPDWFDKVCR